MIDPPAWGRPEGVDPTLWTYMGSGKVAASEEAEESVSPLARFDLELIRAWLPPGSTVLDLGCGTGRASLDLAARGHRIIAVDLARVSLGRLVARRHADQAILPIRASLTRLGVIRPESADAALLLYSTLGMIRGRESRRRVLIEAARCVRPGGTLILHAHNFWANLHPSALGPALRSAGWTRPGRLDRLADRPMLYAGIPGVVIHVYRWGELRADLAAGGWRVAEVVPLGRRSAGPLPAGWLFSRIRAEGWIVRATRLS